MRLAGPPFRLPSLFSRWPLQRAAAAASAITAANVVRALVVAAAAVGAASLLLITVAPATAFGADGVADGLSVEVGPGLGPVGESTTIQVQGKSSAPSQPAQLVVRVLGPAEPSQVGQADPLLPELTTLTLMVDSSVPPEAGWTLSVGSSSWMARTDLAGDVLTEPGGYLVLAELRLGGVTSAIGRAWLGKISPRARPLDVAFVLPVALGVHRDPAGVFFDSTLEQAVAVAGESAGAGSDKGGGTRLTQTPGGLRGVADLAARFPDWDLTLAIEPILLTQLRDMADGYVRLDGSGTPEQIGADDQRAKDAAEAVRELAGAALRQNVEIVAGPWAGADLGALAAEGWRSGFDQIQLGKEELQRTLGLGSAPVGAYSPDLDLTTESLAFYAQASIDHLVVDEQLGAYLTEPVTAGTVAARVRDAGSHRVTLALANSSLRSLMAPPWDPGVFFAGLAAELAAVPREAMVITLGGEFVVPPCSYLDTIGEVMTGSQWVQTHTLTSLFRAHNPGSRPSLLIRSAAGSQGYIEGAMLSSLRVAHAAVADLAAAADSIRGPVEEAHHLLLTAESRWWWHASISPQVASVGLAYADRALAVAEGELAKVKLADEFRSRIVGRSGWATLTVDNAADYPLQVTVLLGGEGLSFPGGDSITLVLDPGRNRVSFDVVAGKGPHRLEARVMAGAGVLDQANHSLRVITVMTILPWAVLAAVVVAGLVLLTIVRLRRRRTRA